MDENTQEILIAEHRRWLEDYPSAHANKWEKELVKAREAMLCEAAVRCLLQMNGCCVEPNPEECETGGPDFLCTGSTGERFCVEATVLDRAALDRSLGFSKPRDETGIREIGFPDMQIRVKCSKKASQLARLNLPGILAIGVFHPEATITCLEKELVPNLMTGRPYMKDGRIETAFENAAFFAPKSDDTYARRSISSLLLCGFAIDPWQVYGVLHPNPIRPFDPKLLSRIAFCELQPGHETGFYAHHWIQDNETTA